MTMDMKGSISSKAKIHLNIPDNNYELQDQSPLQRFQLPEERGASIPQSITSHDNIITRGGKKFVVKTEVFGPKHLRDAVANNPGEVPDGCYVSHTVFEIKDNNPNPGFVDKNNTAYTNEPATQFEIDNDSKAQDKTKNQAAKVTIQLSFSCGQKTDSSNGGKKLDSNISDLEESYNICERIDSSDSNLSENSNISNWEKSLKISENYDLSDEEDYFCIRENSDFSDAEESCNLGLEENGEESCDRTKNSHFDDTPEMCDSIKQEITDDCYQPGYKNTKGNVEFVKDTCDGIKIKVEDDVGSSFHNYTKGGAELVEEFCDGIKIEVEDDVGSSCHKNTKGGAELVEEFCDGIKIEVVDDVGSSCHKNAKGGAELVEEFCDGIKIEAVDDVGSSCHKNAKGGAELVEEFCDGIKIEAVDDVGSSCHKNTKGGAELVEEFCDGIKIEVEDDVGSSCHKNTKGGAELVEEFCDDIKIEVVDDVGRSCAWLKGPQVEAYDVAQSCIPVGNVGKSNFNSNAQHNIPVHENAQVESFTLSTNKIAVAAVSNSFCTIEEDNTEIAEKSYDRYGGSEKSVKENVVEFHSIIKEEIIDDADKSCNNSDKINIFVAEHSYYKSETQNKHSIELCDGGFSNNCCDVAELCSTIKEEIVDDDYDEFCNNSDKINIINAEHSYSKSETQNKHSNEDEFMDHEKSVFPKIRKRRMNLPSSNKEKLLQEAIQKFTCHLCGRSHDNNYRLQVHLLQHKLCRDEPKPKVVKKPVVKLRCQFCRLVLLEKNYERHIRRHTEKFSALRSHDNNYRLQDHVLQHKLCRDEPKPKVVKKPVVKLRCQFCRLVLLEKNYERHIQRHTGKFSALRSHDNNYRLQDHVLQHKLCRDEPKNKVVKKPEVKLRCQFCRLVLLEKNYERHIQRHTEKRIKIRVNIKVPCAICGMFMNKSNLKIHQFLKHKIITSNFSASHKNFHSKETVKTDTGHRQQYQKQSETVYIRTGKVKCDFCEKFVSKRSLKQHKIRRHPWAVKTETKVICEVCGFIMKDNVLERHLQRHQEQDDAAIPSVSKENNVKKVVTRVTCDICGRLLNKKSLKEHHRRLHQKDKTLNSGQSKVDISSKENEKTETKENAVKKTVTYVTCVCDICGKLITKKNLKAHHRRVHQKDKTLNSGQSKVDISSKENEKTETKENAVKKTVTHVTCDICGRLLNKKSLKEHHRRLHQKDKTLNSGQSKVNSSSKETEKNEVRDA